MEQEGEREMASVIWEVGKTLEDAYISLFKAVHHPENYSKEDLLKLIEREAHDLRDAYQDLAEDHGWI